MFARRQAFLSGTAALRRHGAHGLSPGARFHILRPAALADSLRHSRNYHASGTIHKDDTRTETKKAAYDTDQINAMVYVHLVPIRALSLSRPLLLGKLTVLTTLFPPTAAIISPTLLNTGIATPFAK
jgi:hypothetical protein